MTEAKKNLLRTLVEILKELENDEVMAVTKEVEVDEEERNLNEDITNMILFLANRKDKRRMKIIHSFLVGLLKEKETTELKEMIEISKKIKEQNREEFLKINNEMLKILKLEEEAKAKVRELEIKNNRR
ncbi:hypothetical protein I9Y31_001432 [Clostridium perfringens]|nr:hypothetical protein [Clostridium perfringens]